jgi:predicted nuclease of predicted toxin-antitoxin system
VENYGHEVVHIDFAPELGKGTADASIAEYSKADDRVIVTDDDDFVSELDADTFRAVLCFDDVSLSPAEIADIVHRLSEHYPQDELRGIESVGREWL